MKKIKKSVKMDMTNTTDWGPGGCEDIDMKPSGAKNDLTDSFSNEVIPPGTITLNIIYSLPAFLTFSLYSFQSQMFWTSLTTFSAIIILTMTWICTHCHRIVVFLIPHLIIQMHLNGAKT